MLSIGNVWTFNGVLLFSHDRDWTCRRKGRKMHGKKSSLFSNADLSIGSLESIHVKRIYNGIKAKRHLPCWWQVKDSAETGYEYNMQAFKKPSRRWTFIVVAQAAFFFLHIQPWATVNELVYLQVTMSFPSPKVSPILISFSEMLPFDLNCIVAATVQKLISEMMPSDVACTKEARDVLIDCCVGMYWVKPSFVALVTEAHYPWL